MMLKLIRLIVYSIKGNYPYAFEQFDYTNYLRRKTLHKRNANRAKTCGNAAVFDLQYAKDRYAFNLINTYKLAGYDIYLRPNFAFYIGSSGLYFDEVFTFLNVGYFKSEKQLDGYKNVHFIHDYEENGTLDLEGFKSIKITSEGAIRAKSLKFPFGFHPNTYIEANLITSTELDIYLKSNQPDKIGCRVFFAGCTFHPMYEKLKFSFPEFINRNDIFNFIQIKFPNFIGDNSKYGSKEILINNSHLNKLNTQQLFSILKSSDFFIAPPGFEMPFCHNLFEALSCGVIPILQYNDILFPALSNETDCLSFTNLEELHSCIAKALSMEDKEISVMKENVLKYYNQYVNPLNFIKLISERPLDEVYLVHNPNKNLI
jgi:glycosyltransferase involved in cell wall biosynthesis